jgi:hypothetical protein
MLQQRNFSVYWDLGMIPSICAQIIMFYFRKIMLNLMNSVWFIKIEIWGMNKTSTLLGLSLCLRMKGTCSNPRKFGLLVYDAFVHPKGAFVIFCRWSQMLKAPERR